jgi:hypothetical protein
VAKSHVFIVIILTCEEICGQRSYKERLHGVNVQGKERKGRGHDH